MAEVEGPDKVVVIRNQVTNALTSPTVVGSVDGVSLVVGDAAKELLASGRAVAGIKRVLGAQLSCNHESTAADLAITKHLAALSVNGVKAEMQDNLVHIERELMD